MIDLHSKNKTFEIKLASRFDKDGKEIPSKTMSFDTAGEMCAYFERQAPVKARRKRSKANVEGRKKRSELHKQKREAQG